jgi:hypothetical protein
MERTPVDSSVIASVGFDDAGHVLEVEFRSGRVYRYFVVPRAVYEAFMRADSPGDYFNREIKPTFRAEESAV